MTNIARLTGAKATLLRRVAKDFLDVPRRLDMLQWGRKMAKREENAPPCGVVACLAGRIWIRGHAASAAKMRNKRFNEIIDNDARDYAQARLGLSDNEAETLFLPFTPYWPEQFAVAYSESPAGSFQRAGIVADRVEHFIEHGA